jgi:hypothetical protein
MYNLGEGVVVRFFDITGWTFFRLQSLVSDSIVYMIGI